MKKNILFLFHVALLVLSTLVSHAQDRPAPPPPTSPAPAATPPARPSPMSISRTFVGDSYVKIHYSRPSKRGRDIFGALVPYGKVWRTGANEGTEITTTKAIMVGNKRLEAGTYTIFTVPAENQWEVHFSTQLGMWDTGMLDPQTRQMKPNMYDPSKDALVVTAPVSMLPDDAPEVEQFTINCTNDKLEFVWVKTKVTVTLAPAN